MPKDAVFQRETFMAPPTLLLLMSILGLLCFPGGPIRLTNLRLDFVRQVCFFVLPAVVFLVRRFKPAAIHEDFRKSLVGVASVSLLAGIGYGLWFGGLLTNPDEIEACIQTIITTDGERVNVYRTNYLGATGGYSTIYRRETMIVPGLKFVHWTSAAPPPER